MEKFLQKHLGSILSSLLVTVTISLVAMVIQIRTDNELVSQRLSQLESMMMGFEKELKSLGKYLVDNEQTKWSKREQERYQDSTDIMLKAMAKSIEVNSQHIAILQTKIDNLVKKKLDER